MVMVLLLGWTIFIFKTPAYNEANVEKIKNNIFMNPKRSYRKRFFWWLYFTMEVQQIVGQRERSECPVTCVTSSWQTLICSWVRCPYSSRVSTRKLHISCVVASHFVSNGSASPGVAQLRYLQRRTIRQRRHATIQWRTAKYYLRPTI